MKNKSRENPFPLCRKTITYLFFNFCIALLLCYCFLFCTVLYLKENNTISFLSNTCHKSIQGDFFFRWETDKGQRNIVQRINQWSTDSSVSWSLGYKHFLVFTNWKTRQIIISQVPKQNLSERMLLTHAFSNLLPKDNKDNKSNVR